MSFHGENPTWCMQFTHHLVLEMGSMISYNSLWDTKSSDDVVETKSVAVRPSLRNVGIASTHLVK
jgi:hypothetical protein